MLSDFRVSNNKLELVSRVLAATLKQGINRKYNPGAMLAYRELSRILKYLRKSKVYEPKIQSTEIPHSNKTNTTDTEPAVSKPTPSPTTQPTALTGIAHTGRDAYALLLVNPMSPFQHIHTKFLRLVKQHLLYGYGSNELAKHYFYEHLKALCIAHDILRDPVTRTDYDFRQMGIRSESQLKIPDEPKKPSLFNRTPLKIGELLHCAKLLEQPELEIAIDMHKAMPEMMFGEFLVKQEFITQAELESALLGQKLLLAGQITVKQFQMAMSQSRTSKQPLAESLIKHGWIQPGDLVHYQTPPEPLVSTQQSFMPPPPTQCIPTTTNTEYPRSLNISNAIPSWADQLIWTEEPPVGSTSPTEADQVNDKVKKSGKKNTRAARSAANAKKNKKRPRQRLEPLVGLLEPEPGKLLKSNQSSDNQAQRLNPITTALDLEPEASTSQTDSNQNE